MLTFLSANCVPCAVATGRSGAHQCTAGKAMGRSSGTKDRSTMQYAAALALSQALRDADIGAHTP